MIPGLGICSGEEKGNAHEYSSLEYPMERGALWATVHRVEKSWMKLSEYWQHHLN